MLPADSIIVLASVLLVITAQEWTKSDCPAPRSPANGVHFIFDNGKRVQFRCHPGFKMSGSNLADCKHNRWSHMTPRCIPINATSAIVPRVVYDVSCLEKRRPGEQFSWAPKIAGASEAYYRTKNSSYPFNYYLVAVYQCSEGYTLENIENSRLYCQKRMWVGTRPRCVQTDFGKDPCFTNKGGCHHICTSIQNQVSCSCRPEYVLASDGRTCQKGSRPGVNYNVQGDDSRERNDPCRDNNGGCNQYCHTVEGKTKCHCAKGFRLSNNQKTCLDINECEENNGGCDGLCQNFVGTYVCQCLKGYKISSDGRSCRDENECSRNNGHGSCDDKCTNTEGGYICSCTIPGTVLGANNHTCEDVDECKENNFGCSHNCTNTYGKAFCSCPRGYHLGDDDKTCIDFNECEIPEFASSCEGRCINEIGTYRCEDAQEFREPTSSSPICPLGYQIGDNGRCEDIDECKNNSLGCSHECQNTAGSAHCTCPLGYQLDNTRKNCIDVDECEQERTRRCQYQCINTVGSFYCTCPPGYIMTERGSCEDFDECKNNSIGCSHECQNTGGSAHCTCPLGYQLDDTRKNCIDINECEDERRCHHKCVNTPGSFHCACSSGYIMTERGSCKGCQKDFYHSEELNTCLKCPEYSHTQSPRMTSRAGCICENGFIGNLSIQDSCTDIDECEVDNGGCSHNCVNTPGGFHCKCSEGYTLDKEGKTCIDTDECLLNKGGCHQGCINTLGSFKCTCSDGYIVSESNHFTCTDVDECLQDNGGCSHNCVNHKGGYYCTCKNGYRLSSDFRSCVEISCKELPAPHHGKIQCNKNPLEGKVPVNTSCQIQCTQGHKSNGVTELSCGMDGDWNGPLPSCLSLFCPQLERPEHGDVHPKSCLTGSVGVFEKCSFTCEAGYRLVGRAFVKCAKDLKWRPKEMPKCEENALEPFIQCPADVTVTLPPHQNSYYIKLPRPKSNMDQKHIEIYPKWMRSLEANFPAGVTEIYFIAKHPSKNLSANCGVRVNVEDKEPPSVIGCPGDIVLYGDALTPVEVIWEEPIFRDNVRIESIDKTQKPGDKFNIGAHVVHYTAADSSRNIAKCVFTVNILRKECGEPRDILHGEKNCMDLLTSRICEPICDPGYAFFGNASEFYMCGADGIWLPSEDIPGCSPFVAEPEEGCLPGTEFREEIDTDSRICVACLQGMYWEVRTASCVPCPLGSYQDEYGQTACKPCNEDEATNPLCEKSTEEEVV